MSQDRAPEQAAAARAARQVAIEEKADAITAILLACGVENDEETWFGLMMALAVLIEEMAELRSEGQ